MSAVIEVKVPCENVNDPTARIVTWKVAAGSVVQEGAAVAELENSKATFEICSPTGGRIEYRRPLGDEVPVGETLFQVHSLGAPASPPASSPGSVVLQQTPPSPGLKEVASHTSTVFSKKAQELAAELGLDPAIFSGMRFVKEADIRAKAAELSGASTGRSDPAPGSEIPRPCAQERGSHPADAGPLQSGLEGERVPLDRAKLLENRELIAADKAALKCTVHHFCPASGLQQACAGQSPPLARLVVVLYETARLLKKFRWLNACLADDGAWLYRQVNIGFAVDMGRGLKVLVIRDAEQLGFAELKSRYEELLVKYSTNTLAVSDVTGSTFTVTGLGAEGTFAFAPLVNARQAAILGIGGEQVGPAGSSGGFMLSCSFDHRLLGGKQVAEFLGELSRRLAGQAESLRGPAANPPPLCCSRCLQTVEDLRARRAFLLPSVEPPGYLCTQCLSGF